MKGRSVALLALVLLFASSYFPSLGQIIKDSVNAIGFQVACYYSLAGFACAWHFRSEALRSLERSLLLVFWPVASSLFLVFVACYSVPTFDLVTNVVGIGGIAVGIDARDQILTLGVIGDTHRGVFAALARFRIC